MWQFKYIKCSKFRLGLRWQESIPHIRNWYMYNWYFIVIITTNSYKKKTMITFITNTIFPKNNSVLISCRGSLIFPEKFSKLCKLLYTMDFSVNLPCSSRVFLNALRAFEPLHLRGLVEEMKELFLRLIPSTRSNINETNDKYA